MPVSDNYFTRTFHFGFGLGIFIGMISTYFANWLAWRLGQRRLALERAEREREALVDAHHEPTDYHCIIRIVSLSEFRTDQEDLVLEGTQFRLWLWPREWHWCSCHLGGGLVQQRQDIPVEQIVRPSFTIWQDSSDARLIMCLLEGTQDASDWLSRCAIYCLLQVRWCRQGCGCSKHRDIHFLSWYRKSLTT